MVQLMVSERLPDLAGNAEHAGSINMSIRKAVGLLCMAGFVLLLAGCGESEENPYKDLVVVNVYDTQSEYRGIQTGWYAEIIKDRFNVELNFLDTQKPADLEEADLLICSRDDYDPKELKAEGRLLDMEPYLEEVSSAASEILDYKDRFREWNEEGIYVLPTRLSRLSELTPSEENIPLYGIFLNWEAYEAADMPRIRDWEELLAAVEEMKQPGQEGLVLCDDEKMDLLDHISYLSGAFGYERYGFLFYEAEKREFEPLLAEDSAYFKGLLQLKEAYEKGLLAQNSSKFSYAEMKNAYEQGKALVSIWPELEAEGYELAPVEKLKVVSHGCNPSGSLNIFAAMGAHTQNPQRVAELIGWLYSTEGIMYSGTSTELKAAGPKGLTWTMEEGNPVLTDFGKQVLLNGQTGNAEVPKEWGGGFWLDGSCHLSLQPVTNVEVTPSGFTYNFTMWDTVTEEYGTASASWKEYMEAQTPVEYLIEHDNLSVIPSYVDNYVEKAVEEPQETVDKRNDCRKVIVDYSWKMIFSKTEEEYERLKQEMIKKASALGYEEIIAYDHEKAAQAE